MGGSRASFQTTLWADVLKAKDLSQPDAKAALEKLIQAYWKPVYFQIRRKGHGIDDAKDLTQEFFARLLERDGLKGVDRGRGRFRSYLLGALKHFLSDDTDRRHALKRTPTFDTGRAEAYYRPGHSFERDWALEVLERAFLRLMQESPREAAAADAILRDLPYRELAERLKTTEQAVQVLAHRARKRLRQILADELAPTVNRPADLISEVDDLLKALSG